MKRTLSSTTAIRGPLVSLLTSFGLEPSMALRTGLSKPLRGMRPGRAPPSSLAPAVLPARSLARADARTHAFRTLTIVANGSQSDIRGRIRFMRRGSHAVERVA